jgi:DNA-binding FadR family transcriptional regulator
VTETKTKSPREHLAERIIKPLREQLASGELEPGDRLPTEKALCEAYGVSRTVVREAIAALRADRLVVVRQGSGAFVAERVDPDLASEPFTFDKHKVSSIIEVLELRTAVESSAAALAAHRRSPAELARIKERHDEFGTAISRGSYAEAEDAAFHLAIAEATHNRHFVEFFHFLGSRTIPRAQALNDSVRASAAKAYIGRIHEEHAKIVAAISDQDGARAGEAMIEHLKVSQKRYAKLLEEASKGGSS